MRSLIDTPAPRGDAVPLHKSQHLEYCPALVFAGRYLVGFNTFLARQNLQRVLHNGLHRFVPLSADGLQQRGCVFCKLYINRVSPSLGLLMPSLLV